MRIEGRQLRVQHFSDEFVPKPNDPYLPGDVYFLGFQVMDDLCGAPVGNGEDCVYLGPELQPLFQRFEYTVEGKGDMREKLFIEFYLMSL